MIDDDLNYTLPDCIERGEHRREEGA